MNRKKTITRLRGKKKIKLGVNVDHIATLRQIRGASTPYPDLLHLALKALKAGADQITIHLREDRRHIQLSDLKALCGYKNSKNERTILVNLETAVSEEATRLAKRFKPHWLCLVPEKREELTTEGGLNLLTQYESIKKLLKEVQPLGIEVSAFIEPSIEMVRVANELKFDAVEFHTGHWVLSKGRKREKIWQELVASAVYAHELGLRVHAGHGLDYGSAREIAKLPFLEEVNIGHSIVCYSIEFGLEAVVRKFRNILSGVSQG